MGKAKEKAKCKFFPQSWEDRYNHDFDQDNIFLSELQRLEGNGYLKTQERY